MAFRPASADPSLRSGKQQCARVDRLNQNKRLRVLRGFTDSTQSARRVSAVVFLGETAGILRFAQNDRTWCFFHTFLTRFSPSLARSKQVIEVQASQEATNVYNTFTEANFEAQKPALPEKVQ
jgi:hypothetical protein